MEVVETRRVQKMWLVAGMSLIVLSLMLLMSSAVFEGDVTLSEYSGVIIESKDEVNVANSQIARAESNIPQAGTSPSNPVTMSSTTPPPSASIGVARGKLALQVRRLLDRGKNAGQPSVQGGALQVGLNKLRLHSGRHALHQVRRRPGRRRGARLYFDLGSSKPESSEAFMVVVSRV